MNIEQIVNYQLNKYPALKKAIKRVYQRTMYVVSPKIKSEGNITRISPDDQSHEYFFGYYDKSPWDITDRYVLCMRANDTWSDVSPQEPADILLIDTEKAENDSDRVKKIAETRSWNVQQACMLQWLGPDFGSRVLYNDYRDGKYVAVILTLETMEEKVIPAAVYSVSADGKFALTLDFSRLYNLRPGYGYYNMEEKTKGVALPDTTAIWRVNLETGEVQDLLKYTDFADFQPRPEMKEEGSVHKVNHIMLSPNGKRFMVLYRWFIGQKKYTRLITCNVDGSDMYLLSDDDMVSHCCWKDDEHILAFENKTNIGTGYYLMRDNTEEFVHLWPQMTGDGHPSYSPNGKDVVTDTYPDRTRIARINIMKADENANVVKTMAKVFAPFRYDNDTRCDLHPRWSRKGDKVAFDSVFEGKRNLYFVNIGEMKKKETNIQANPFVSVVIPTHNRSKDLQRAIYSVLNQTYDNIEVIIVSDGSDDDTKKVVEDIQKKDKKVKFIEYHPARGANVARNTGIKSANGEYIAFLDDDDEWKKNKLKSQMEVVLNDSNIGLVYTGADIIYANQNIKYKSCPNAEGDLSSVILLGNCIGTTSSVMVKKSILDEVGLFDEKLPALQDFEMWIRVCQKTHVGVVNKAMINYYNELGKIQISASTIKYINAFQYINNKHSHMFKNLSKEKKIIKFNNEKFLLANKAMRNGDSKLARQYIRDILRNGFNKKAIVYYILSFLNYKYVLRLRKYI